MKIVLLGDRGVGKSTLIQLLKGGKFSEKIVPTIGTVIHHIKIGENNYQIWDCSEPDKNQETMFLKTDAVIIMCTQDTINGVEDYAKSFLKTFQETKFLKVEKTPTIYLVVNKSDEEFVIERKYSYAAISCKNNELDYLYTVLERINNHAIAYVPGLGLKN